MHVTHTNKTLLLGTSGHHAKCLLFVLLLLLVTALLPQSTYANTALGPISLARSELAAEPTIDTISLQKETLPQPGFNPKLTLTTNISSVKLSSSDSIASASKIDPLMIAVRSQPKLNRSALAAEAVVATKNTTVDFSYQAKKEDVEKALENENRLLIAFVLMFVAAVGITYVVTRNKRLL